MLAAGTLNVVRLFAALPLSPEALERFTRLRLRHSTPNDGLRWSTPEQWHITLQFFGELEISCANALLAGFASLHGTQSPQLTIEGLDQFPSKGILYASVVVTPELLELHARVAEQGRACGILPESRPFRPHVTLARSKGQKGIKSLQRLATPELPSVGPPLLWRPEQVLLLRSELRPGGAEYDILAVAELEATGSVQGSS